ncbi:MAG: cytochrome c nitrite reductase small subunit [Acidobacteria bacterium]|nr:cytochrome c nitrite reductase small subunit [Acidobacteriota bacterium]
MKNSPGSPGRRDRSKAQVPLLVLSGTLGISLGIGIFTFLYARGHSYLVNDPAACANCHVMQRQYESWMKGSHRSVAVCNDCHTPPGTAGKYTTKARNGITHSWAFTSGRFPDEIRITAHNYRVTEESCVKCHEQLVAAIQGTREPGSPVSCIRCHAFVGHR